VRGGRRRRVAAGRRSLLQGFGRLLASKRTIDLRPPRAVSLTRPRRVEPPLLDPDPHRRGVDFQLGDSRPALPAPPYFCNRGLEQPMPAMRPLLVVIQLSALAERRSSACSFENAEVDLEHDQRTPRHRIAWLSGGSSDLRVRRILSARSLMRAYGLAVTLDPCPGPWPAAPIRFTTPDWSRAVGEEPSRPI
jgi:hypothetical protein